MSQPRLARRITPEAPLGILDDVEAQARERGAALRRRGIHAEVPERLTITPAGELPEHLIHRGKRQSAWQQHYDAAVEATTPVPATSRGGWVRVDLGGEDSLRGFLDAIKRLRDRIAPRPGWSWSYRRDGTGVYLRRVLR